MSILSEMTLRDLCLSYIINSSIKDEKEVLPIDLSEEITDLQNPNEYYLYKLVFSCKRVGLWKLVIKNDKSLKKAAESGCFPLVHFLIGSGLKNWNYGLYGAARGGHLSLVNFFIEKGADDYKRAMCYAAQRSRLELVEFFIEKGVNRLENYNEAMSWAAQGGHLHLVDFFISKGADDWIMGWAGAMHGGHKELEKFFIKKTYEVSS